MTKFHYLCHQIIESCHWNALFIVIRASIVFGFFVCPLLSLSKTCTSWL